MFNSVAKFFGLLNKKYKIFYVFLFISFGVNILIDLISIAAIFPIIFFIFDKDAVLNSVYYVKFRDLLSNYGVNFQYENSTTVLIFLIILIIIFLIRTLIVIFINYFSIKLEIKTKYLLKIYFLKLIFHKIIIFNFLKI